MSFKVVKATERHAADVGENMRRADIIEVEAAAGVGPLAAASYSYISAEACWAATNDDRTVLLFGVSPTSILSTKGRPWLLGTPEVDKLKMQIAKRSKMYVSRMLLLYDYLENWVDVRNSTSIRWLKWCGFELDPPKPYGVRCDMFHRFWMEKKQCV